MNATARMDRLFERRAKLNEIVWRGVDSAALIVLAKLGVFQKLLDGPKSAAELAESATSIDRLQPFLDLAVALGALRRAGEDYALVPGDEPLMDPAQPEYEIFGSLNLHALAQAADLLRESEPLSKIVVPAVHEQGRISTADWRAYVIEWDQRVRLLAAEVASVLAEERFEYLADFACGGGTFARALLSRVDGARACLFDVSEVCLSVARELGAAEGVDSRMEFSRADLMATRLEGPTGFDLALMSVFLSGFSAVDARRLIKTGAARMRASARLAIIEPAIADDGSGPQGVLRYAAYQAVEGREGALHSEAQLKQWGAEAGLEFVGSRPLGAIDPEHRLIVLRASPTHRLHNPEPGG